MSKATGTLPGGTVTVDNTRRTNPSDTVTSYWTKGGPKEASFEFGIGGSNANYADYWKKIALAEQQHLLLPIQPRTMALEVPIKKKTPRTITIIKRSRKTEEKKNEQKEDD